MSARPHDRDSITRHPENGAMALSGSEITPVKRPSQILFRPLHVSSDSGSDADYPE
jgi:hypothetical protein